MAAQIFTIETGLTAREADTRARIADAQHLSEITKYRGYSASPPRVLGDKHDAKRAVNPDEEKSQC
jgi:hypothetical protein